MSTDDTPDLSRALDDIDRLIDHAAATTRRAYFDDTLVLRDGQRIIEQGAELLDRLTASAARLRPVVQDERAARMKRRLDIATNSLSDIAEAAEGAGLPIDEWPERLRPLARAIVEAGYEV